MSSEDDVLDGIFMDLIHERMEEADNVLGRDLHRMFRNKKTAEDAALIMALEHIDRAVDLMILVGDAELAANALKRRLVRLEETGK